jgi:hypothetical protein
VLVVLFVRSFGIESDHIGPDRIETIMEHDRQADTEAESEADREGKGEGQRQIGRSAERKRKRETGERERRRERERERRRRERGQGGLCCVHAFTHSLTRFPVGVQGWNRRRS